MMDAPCDCRVIVIILSMDTGMVSRCLVFFFATLTFVFASGQIDFIKGRHLGHPEYLAT